MQNTPARAWLGGGFVLWGRLWRSEGGSGGAVAAGGHLGEGLAAAGDVFAHQLLAAGHVAVGEGVADVLLFDLPE